MNFSGSITFTIETEEDIILAAQLIQHKRGPSFSVGNHPSPPMSGTRQPTTDASTNAESRSRRTISDDEVIEKLRTTYPNGSFTSAQADEIIKGVAGVSSWTASRIRGKAIRDGKLKRLKMGEFTFEDCAPHATREPQKEKRRLSGKRLSELRTLQNPILFMNFLRKLRELNPDGIDEQLINRDLEPQEALNDLHKKYPNLIVFKEEERDFRAEFRDYLASLGIDNAQVQDLVIARMESDDPFTEETLKVFAQAQSAAVQKDSMIAVSAQT